MPAHQRQFDFRCFAATGWAAAVVVFVSFGVWPPAPAAANLRENFEGPQTSWRYAATDAALRISQHQRATSNAHWGHGCEALRLSVGNGTHVFFEHDIGRPVVIDELQASVWVRGSRPGVQLLARVVFPRTLDATTGQPVTTLVQGGLSSRADAWEPITLESVPQLVARQVRVLRLQLGRDIDQRGAYLDRLVLNAYCAPGEMLLLIDDLEVTGYVASGQVRTAALTFDESPEAKLPSNAIQQISAQEPIERVALRSSTLTVGERPFFPRVIEHRGEALDYLKQLGFNGVRMFVPPTAAQLAEARRAGLWLICPPPEVLRGAAIGPEHDCVLAWQLGEGLGGRHATYVRQLADAVRQADGQTARPLLAGASEQLRTYSRHVDVLAVDRRPVGTALELIAWRDWILSRQQLARPGTPQWITVQTQPLPSLVDQWSARGGSAPHIVEPQQLRLLAHAALAAGARGLLFASHERLDQEGEETQLRAQSLALLNLELELIEPWLAVCASPSEIRTTTADTQATMFASTHSHLLLAMRLSPLAQYVTAGPARTGLVLVVPGVPDSTEAYLLSPAGLRPLVHQRVTGGVRVSIDDFGWVGAVVFTSDPLVYARLAQTSARHRARAAELQQAIVTTMLARTKRQLEPLAAAKRTPPDVTTAMTLVEANMAQCARLRNSGDAQAIYTFASRAEQSLSQIRRATWERVARETGSPTQRLALASFDTLGDILQEPPPRAAGQGVNYLAGGNMEDLQLMLDNGWRHFRRDLPGVRSGVDLAAGGPLEGRFTLRLEATSDTASAAAAPVEASPVWIRSGDLPLRAGQRIEIHGQVRIDRPITSGDGLLIYDSLAGRELALRLPVTQGWQEFALHRTAPRDGSINLTIELSGLGQALVDNLEVVVVD